MTKRAQMSFQNFLKPPSIVTNSQNFPCLWRHWCVLKGKWMRDNIIFVHLCWCPFRTKSCVCWLYFFFISCVLMRCFKLLIAYCARFAIVIKRNAYLCATAELIFSFFQFRIPDFWSRLLCFFFGKGTKFFSSIYWSVFVNSVCICIGLYLYLH